MKKSVWENVAMWCTYNYNQENSIHAKNNEKEECRFSPLIQSGFVHTAGEVR